MISNYIIIIYQLQLFDASKRGCRHHRWRHWKRNLYQFCPIDYITSVSWSHYLLLLFTVYYYIWFKVMSYTIIIIYQLPFDPMFPKIIPVSSPVAHINIVPMQHYFNCNYQISFAQLIHMRWLLPLKIIYYDGNVHHSYFQIKFPSFASKYYSDSIKDQNYLLLWCSTAPFLATSHSTNNCTNLFSCTTYTDPSELLIILNLVTALPTNDLIHNNRKTKMNGRNHTIFIITKNYSALLVLVRPKVSRKCAFATDIEFS